LSFDTHDADPFTDKRVKERALVPGFANPEVKFGYVRRLPENPACTGDQGILLLRTADKVDGDVDRPVPVPEVDLQTVSILVIERSPLSVVKKTLTDQKVGVPRPVSLSGCCPGDPGEKSCKKFEPALTEFSGFPGYSTSSPR
jgi:hypothetical protein